MPNQKNTPIIRLQDGSIDYHHYAAQGMNARNREMRKAARIILDATKQPIHTLPVFVTVMLLVLIF